MKLPNHLDISFLAFDFSFFLTKPISRAGNPIIKRLSRFEHFRNKKIHQTPKLVEIVLKGSASEQ